MFKSKTLYVVGAGAGAEIDMPVGSTLATTISGLLDIEIEWGTRTKGDAQLCETIVHHQGSPSPDELYTAARHISAAMQMAQSIDTFLDSYPEDDARKLVGKMAIAKAIMAAERGSKLRPSGRNKPFEIRTVKDTWFVTLAQLLFSGVRPTDVRDIFQNTAFIVFNYDRCLEAFLTRALQVYFELEGTIADEIVRSATILHPYGKLGSIFANDGPRVSFAAERCDLPSVASQLSTFTESIKDERLLASIRHEFQTAETIIFLGYAFHAQNMDVLAERLPKSQKSPAVKNVFATTYEVSDPDVEIIRAQIGEALWGRPPRDRDSYEIHTFGGSCYDLFREYWRSLSA